MTEPASHETHAHEPPPPDEPKSPMWLPALGAALFITVGLWWAVTPSPPPPPEEPAVPEGAASAAPQAAASAPRPAVAPGGGAGQPGAGGPDNAALQRILEKLPKQ